VAIKESITQNTIANKLNGIHISPADPLSDRRPSLATVNVKSKVDQFEGSNDSNDVTEKLFELMKLVRDFATLCGQYELPITQPSPTSAQKLGWSIGLDTDDVDQMAQILEQDVERVVRVILYQSQSDTLDNVDTISTIKEILMSSGDLVSKCDGIVGTFDGADSDQVEYQVSRLSLLNGITKVVQLCQQLYNGDDLRRLSTTSDEKRVSFMGGQTDPAWLTKELISSLRTVLKLSTELVYQLKYILNEKQAKLSYFLQVAVQKSPEQLAHAGLLNASRDLVGERRGSEMSAGSRGSYIPRHSYQSSRQSRQSQQSK
jgi:hypothetical protein